MGYIKFKTTTVDVCNIIKADNILNIIPDDNKLNITLDSGITDESTAVYAHGVQVTYSDSAFLASSVVDKWREAIVKASGLQGGTAIVVDESEVATAVSVNQPGKAEQVNLTF